MGSANLVPVWCLQCQFEFSYWHLSSSWFAGFSRNWLNWAQTLSTNVKVRLRSILFLYGVEGKICNICWSLRHAHGLLVIFIFLRKTLCILELFAIQIRDEVCSTLADRTHYWLALCFYASFFLPCDGSQRSNNPSDVSCVYKIKSLWKH